MDTPDFSVTTSEAVGGAVVAVAGEIDVYTAPSLRETLLELTKTGTNRVVVDLERTTFIDSTGLGVLVAHWKRTRAAGGDTILRSVPHNVMRVLTITGLTRVFTIERMDRPQS